MANIDTFNINGTKYNFPNYRLVVVSKSTSRSWNPAVGADVVESYWDSQIPFNFVSDGLFGNDKSYFCTSYNGVNAVGGGHMHFSTVGGQSGSQTHSDCSYSIAYLEKY